MAAVPSIGRATAVEPLAAPAEALGCRLYEAHSSLVLKYCLGRLRNREDAEDAAQTTFVYALRALRRGVVPEAETAWLLTIARNVCHERGRVARRRGDLEAPHDPQVLQEIAPAVEAKSGDAEALSRALTHLPTQQRQAIVLREWHGLAYREIAARLQLTQGAVESLIFRARRSLAEALERDGQTSLRAVNLGSLLAGAKSLLDGAAAVKLAGALAASAAALAIATGAASDGVPEPRPSAPPAPARATKAVTAGFPRAVDREIARMTPTPTRSRSRGSERDAERPAATSQVPDPFSNDEAGSKVGALSDTTTDVTGAGSALSATTTAVTDAAGPGVDETIATVEDAASSILAPATSLLPATEPPALDVPELSLP